LDGLRRAQRMIQALVLHDGGDVNLQELVVAHVGVIVLSV
jgi:hypothetical protein